ncbi:cAMP-regulated phosphoprotein 21-like isoform X2 [Iris pallida]|uniref:cAMP-regulated phosphoprotein 21-like isoform X2 n=1 Tax=Iris pallida TaxID=29817 RepID=A0AAX6DH91_IRIPA|nr:cAMP-regulated phosphoprotein 21-like isoform X2 [Iris pallida]
MESPFLSCAPVHDSDTAKEGDGEGRCAVGVDAFLVEALYNPRHRLTVLRMELYIQILFRIVTNNSLNSIIYQLRTSSVLHIALHNTMVYILWHSTTS